MERLIQKRLELIKGKILLNHLPWGKPAAMAQGHSNCHWRGPGGEEQRPPPHSHHQPARHVDAPSWNWIFWLQSSHRRTAVVWQLNSKLRSEPELELPNQATPEFPVQGHGKKSHAPCCFRQVSFEVICMDEKKVSEARLWKGKKRWGGGWLKEGLHFRKGICTELSDIWPPIRGYQEIAGDFSPFQVNCEDKTQNARLEK